MQNTTTAGAARATDLLPAAGRLLALLLAATALRVVLRAELPPESPPLVDLGTIGRAAAYLVLVLLLGAWTVVRLLLPRLAGAGQAVTATLTGAVWRTGRMLLPLLAAAAVARGAAQVAAFRDPAEPLTGSWLVALATTTIWGRVWLLQAAAAVALWLAWPTATVGRRRDGVVVPLLLLAVVAEGLAGHGLAGRWAGLVGVGLHVLHLLGAGAWLGALAITALVLPRRPAPEADLLPPLYAAIAPIALAGAAGVVGAGVLMGVEYAGGLGALWPPRDDYARALLVKAGVAGGVLALGAWHWRVAVPGLAVRGEAAFRRTLRLELTLTLLVLAVSAVLVALPAAGV